MQGRGTANKKKLRMALARVILFQDEREKLDSGKSLVVDSDKWNCKLTGFGVAIRPFDLWLEAS